MAHLPDSRTAAGSVREDTSRTDRPERRGTVASPPLSMPTAALLEAWSRHSWSSGVQIEQLQEFDVLTVRTRNSVYEIVVRRPQDREVLVRGGRYFPEFTPVRVAGSSLGGSFLKLGGVYAGFRLELQLGIRVVMTSPVESIVVQGSNPSEQ